MRRSWFFAAAVILVAAALFVLYRHDPAQTDWYWQCPWQKYLHWRCPGCGSTRAAYHLLHGEWQRSFAANWLLLPLLAVGALCWRYPQLLAGKRTIALALIVLLALTILRNLYSSDPQSALPSSAFPEDHGISESSFAR